MMMMVTTIYTENTKKKWKNETILASLHKKDEQLEMMIIPAWVSRRGANGL